ncbi:MAG: exodeoxyribonuclease VII small subunit [Fusicatenibacter sp.]|nr:exodeoxyribonuclease VII small subunit [Lachnospiraceae bacterium]MDY2937640.1 exodeoxyribonuclease VII small subunit [Fusicatenibacter sp.]
MDSEKTLETAFGELDQLIQQLESSEITLEESFRVYKEGMELLRYCNGKIDMVEKKMLQMNQDGTLTEF